MTNTLNRLAKLLREQLDDVDSTVAKGIDADSLPAADAALNLRDAQKLLNQALDTLSRAPRQPA